jgi:probable HAF family extracellular repeat protein
MRDIGTLGGPDAAVFDMSNAGAVGLSYTNSIPNTSGIPTIDPFLWVNGSMIDLGTLGGTFGSPEWINTPGQVVGESNLEGDLVSHPFLWDHGVLTDLGTLGGNNGSAFFINDAGTIVGRADLPGSTVHHGFLWKRGVMSDLGTVGSDPCSVATHINEREQVVGKSTDCHRALRAFLWEKGEIVDLNSLVNPPSDAQVFEPSYINERGEITGIARLPNGDVHAVVLIPNGDCDSSCESRIAASQANPTVAPRPRAARLSPAQRMRAMIRQRFHLPSFEAPED